MKKSIKLNIGCGENKLEGFVNIDVEPRVKPDLVHDVVTTRLPFKENSVDIVHCIHNIEHIELKHWHNVLADFWRVLKPKGKLYLAYPEFEICAKYFVTNHQGQKDFWRATLYGRQLYPGDFHVTPVVTKDLAKVLHFCGFDGIKHTPEPEHDYNTFLVCYKDKRSETKEDIIKKAIFK